MTKIQFSPLSGPVRRVISVGTYFSLKNGPFVSFVQGDVELEQMPPAQE